ncbi:MAG TPA: serine hydrolase [Candidatus Limnocylindria bacterium]|nr:serine hydrolase [Candidatus Limnocylindria bacterium]
MRRFALLLAAGLVLGPLTALAGVPVAGSTADLVLQVDGLVRSFPGAAGVYVSDPSSPEPLYTHEADEQFITASLYKLGILAEVETRVEAGTLKYSDAIEIQPEDITDDGSFESSGTVMSVDEALEAMITVSDNGTALAFWHLLGPANINATLQKLGLNAFHVANDDSEDNTATPRVIGQYFGLLVQRTLVSAAASDRMLARLERQRINDRLPAQLPANTVVAHKTGNLAGVTHDAGIIYTKSGPRIVVGMTADTEEDAAAHFISGLGALVYAAVLEPPANARFQVPRTAPSYETSSEQRLAVAVTNSGSRAWTATGAASVGLIWEIRDAQKKLVDQSRSPVALSAQVPAATAPATVAFTVPGTTGDYTMTVGLADANGTALAQLGAATASFDFHVHVPYLVAAQVQLPTLLHRNEASLVIVQYSNLPGAGREDHTYTLFWRALDPATRRSVASGSSPLGRSIGPGGGTFFAPFNAPPVRGTYRFVMEVREGGKTASATQIVTAEISGPRTYPDDRDSAGVAPPGPRQSAPPQRSGGPQLTGLPPRGRSPSPSPRR